MCPSARHEGGGGGGEEIQRQQTEVSGQFHARAPLLPGKNSGTQSRSGLF